MSRELDKIFNAIADGLADQGFAVIDRFLAPAEAEAVRQSDVFLHHKLHFRKAGIGNTDKQFNDQIRGDYIQWIDPATASEAEQVYLKRLRDLLPFLNQNLYLSLKDVELHRTVYPVGSRYQRHLDQFRNDDHRKLSVICYLNSDWKEHEGGQLTLYLPEGPHTILPLAGRMVCFRSDQLEHEVLPATRERYSITGWAIDRISRTG